MSIKSLFVLVRYWLLLTVLFLVAACAFVSNKNTQPHTFVFENFVEGNKVLVLPVYSILNDFRAYAPALFESIAEDLERHGFDVFELTDKEFSRFRKQALQDVGAIYSPELKQLIAEDPLLYINTLIASLMNYGDFDLMLVPELHIKKAQLNGESLEWDSVREKLIVRNARLKDWQNRPKLHRALSLRIYYFSKQAGQVIARDVGLSIPYEIVLNEAREASYLTPQYIISQDQIDRALNFIVKPLRQDLFN